MYEDDDATAVIITPAPDAPDEFYCVHGCYVGGMGADLMCGYCEGGYTWAEFQHAMADKVTTRDAAENVTILSDYLTAGLEHIATMLDPDTGKWTSLSALEQTAPGASALLHTWADGVNGLLARERKVYR